VISPFFGFGFGGWGYPFYPYYYPYYAAPAVPYYSQPVYRDNTYVLPSQTTTSKYDIQSETPAQAPPAPTSIVVVLKSGQQIEAPGYALVGSTLWILDSQNATPYSISDVDIAATQAENHKRGVDIVIPSTQPTR